MKHGGQREPLTSLCSPLVSAAPVRGDQWWRGEAQPPLALPWLPSLRAVAAPLAAGLMLLNM